MGRTRVAAARSAVDRNPDRLVSCDPSAMAREIKLGGDRLVGMDRRSFLRGLAATTALVSVASPIPAPAAGYTFPAVPVFPRTIALFCDGAPRRPWRYLERILVEGQQI